MFHVKPKEILKKEQAKLDRIRWHAQLVRDLKAYKLYDFVQEHRFHAIRQFRFDIAFVDRKLAIEIDGGIWLDKGGHQTGTGYQNDRDKDELALLDGWRVYRVTPKMVKSGRAVQTIEKLLIN